MGSRKRINVTVQTEVDVNEVIKQEAGRRKLFRESIHAIMEEEGLSWDQAKLKLYEELKKIRFRRLFKAA